MLVLQAPRELLPAARTDSPRDASRAPSESANASRTIYALPPRPGNNQPAAPHSLAARMGSVRIGSEARTPSRHVSPARIEASPAPQPQRSRSPDKEVVPIERDSVTSSDPRKRPHDGAFIASKCITNLNPSSESALASREASPGEAKRIKIDRDRARGHHGRGKEAGIVGQNRLLANAMKSAAPAEK